MVIGVVAACAVLVACGLAVYAVRRSRQDAERRLELVLERLGSHLDAISAGVEQSVERVVAAQATAAAAADARLRRARRRHRRRGRRADGRGRRRASGRRPRRPAGHRDGRGARGRRARRAHVGASRRAAVSRRDDRLDVQRGGRARRRAVPLGARRAARGVRRSSGNARRLLDGARTRSGRSTPRSCTSCSPRSRTGLANARRFADVEARLLLDPETGVTNRRGYEVELGREVARASRTGRPLSVVLVGISNGPDTYDARAAPKSVDQFARLLTRVTRRSDISCRRGEREFAILLPETRESGATVLTNRLREEARRALGTGQTSIAVGRVEWQPDESLEALEARVEAASRRSGAARTDADSPHRFPSRASATIAAPARSRGSGRDGGRVAARRARGRCARDPGRASVRPLAGRRRPRRRRARGALGARPRVGGRGARQRRGATLRERRQRARSSASAQASSSSCCRERRPTTRRRCSAACTLRASRTSWPASSSPPASPSSSSATEPRPRSGAPSTRSGRQARRVPAPWSSPSPVGGRRDPSRRTAASHRPVWAVQCDRGTSFEVASPVRVSTRRVSPNELAHHVATTIVIIAAALVAAAVLVAVLVSRRQSSAAPPERRARPRGRRDAEQDGRARRRAVRRTRASRAGEPPQPALRRARRLDRPRGAHGSRARRRDGDPGLRRGDDGRRAPGRRPRGRHARHDRRRVRAAADIGRRRDAARAPSP